MPFLHHAVSPGMLDDFGCDTWSVSRLLRQVRVVLLLIAGIITAAGWLVFAIALEFTLNDGLTLRGLVVCLFGMALVGVLSIASRAERETHRTRGGATQWPFFTTPRAVFVVVWLSLVGAASGASESFSRCITIRSTRVVADRLVRCRPVDSRVGWVPRAASRVGLGGRIGRCRGDGRLADFHGRL